MTGDVTQFINLKLKAEGHVTYGDKIEDKFLEEEMLVLKTQPLLKMYCMLKG